MKKNSIILAAIGAALLLLRRRPAAGVGKVRRNIFREISWLQEHDVPLGRDYNRLDWSQQNDVARMCTYAKYRQSEASRRNGESLAESYYKSLSRQYLKLVNPAIGRIQYPHTTSVIRNSRGDVVLTYNDYDPDKDLSAALDWAEDSNDPYTKTVRAIAAGHKFIWKGKRKGGTLLTRGLADELFFSKTNLEGERKAYRAIIDNKNGWTIDKFVEEQLGGSLEARNAALDALKEFPSPKAAREYILEQYYQSLDDGTPDYEAPNDMDLPF